MALNLFLMDWHSPLDFVRHLSIYQLLKAVSCAQEIELLKALMWRAWRCWPLSAVALTALCRGVIRWSIRIIINDYKESILFVWFCVAAPPLVLSPQLSWRPAGVMGILHLDLLGGGFIWGKLILPKHWWDECDIFKKGVPWSFNHHMHRMDSIRNVLISMVQHSKSGT